MNQGAPLNTESCGICGATLDYLERAEALTCVLCGRSESGHVVCREGHYLCERCHGGDVDDEIRRRLAETAHTVPTAIAEELLSLPDLPMLGCEHALVAAGSLMAALRNRDLGVGEEHVAEVLARTERQAISAYCGLTGVCGVVPALGACYSVLVGGQCGKGPETRGAMELVERLAAVTAGEADPGCCKAYVRSCLIETEQFLEERLGIPATNPIPVTCADSGRHPHGCRGADCAYHPEHVPEGTMAGEPQAPPQQSRASTAADAQSEYDAFFSLAYADGALDRRTKILVALGASLGAGCAP